MVNVLNWKKWTVGELVSQTKTTIQTGPFGTVLCVRQVLQVFRISVRQGCRGYGICPE